LKGAALTISLSSFLLSPFVVDRCVGIVKAELCRTIAVIGKVVKFKRMGSGVTPQFSWFRACGDHPPSPHAFRAFKTKFPSKYIYDCNKSSLEKKNMYPSICVPDVIGMLAVWIENKKENVHLKF